MTVLETFLILFETNSDQFKKEATDAEKSLDSFEKKVKDTDNTTNKLRGSFTDMAVTAGKMLAGFFAAQSVMSNIFQQSQVSAFLNDSSEALGINTEMLSSWGGAVKENGGSVEGFIGTLRSLSTQMATLDTMGKSRLKPFFDQLGISLLDAHGKSRPVMEVLPELADAFEKMSKQESTSFGQKIGLDSGTILLLQKGKKEVAAVVEEYKKLGVVTEHDAKVADDFHDAMDRMGYVFGVMWTKIGTLLLPVLKTVVEAVTKMTGIFINNGRLVSVSLGVIAGVLSFKMMPALLAMVPIIGKMALAGMAAAAPFLLWGAAIGAVIVIGEDLLAWWEGAPSVFGTIIAKIKQMFLDAWDDIKTSFQAVFAFTPAGLAFQTTKQALDFGSKMIGGNDQITSTITPEQKAAFWASKNSSQSNSVQIGEIKVQTQATDADGISKAIGQSLDTQMRNSLNNMDDGIKG